MLGIGNLLLYLLMHYSPSFQDSTLLPSTPFYVFLPDKSFKITIWSVTTLHMISASSLAPITHNHCLSYWNKRSSKVTG
jgi:hypothetical protein